MISAFFLTGTLVRRIEAGKSLAIGSQWVRTFKRLLPPAAVVIVATVVAGVALLPESRHTDLFRSAWSSLFYGENWRLAFTATDYYADKSSASPLQHFWSLSVQGQVFILWPLVFLLVALLVKRFSSNPRVSAFAVLSIVFAASLVYSVLTTQSRQEFAYFDTGARLWEFAAGGLLAIALPWIKLPYWTRAALGIVGLAALLSCGMLLDVQGGFPGYLALWPILSIGAIIVAGTGTGTPTPVTWLLERRPLLALGKDAYALYLIHWPILVFSLVAKHGKSLSFGEGLLVIIASIVLARLLTWAVDDRIRYAKWANASNARGLLAIGLAIVCAAAPTAAFHWSAHQQLVALKEQLAQTDASETNPGAAAIGTTWTLDKQLNPPAIPLASDLENDWGSLPEQCDDWFPEGLSEETGGCMVLHSDEPTKTVFVVGDSHTQQFLPMIEPLAQEQHWELRALLKGGCSLRLDDLSAYEGSEDAGQACIDWNALVFDLIDQVRPDFVIGIASAASPVNAAMEPDAGQWETVRDGTANAVAMLNEWGIPFVGVRDNPRFTFDAYACGEAIREGLPGYAEAQDASPECGVSRAQALAELNPVDSLVQPGVASLDFTDLLCVDGECPAIIGNVFVYRDNNHLSVAYARTMAPFVGPRILAAAEQAASWS